MHIAYEHLQFPLMQSVEQCFFFIIILYFAAIQMRHVTIICALLGFRGALSTPRPTHIVVFARSSP